ncbi:MAG: ABC transporter substrate-binding protein [Chloroflexota bacterium]|nr:ABC transporter substrate-binding protein [Chloroflexota bacterium]
MSDLRERRNGHGPGSPVSSVTPLSALLEGAMSGRFSRRQILRRAAALGISGPMLAAMLKIAPDAAAQDGTPAAPPPSGEPVVIGCPYNLTGSYASLDNPARDGSELAAEELNRSGGILGRPVRLQVYDGKSDVPTITSVVKRLVEEDKVPALAGLTDTSYMFAGGQVAQEAGVPFLDVGGTAPIITSIGDYIFMLPFGDNVQAAASAEFAQAKGWQTCALLFDEAMDYTKFLAKYFKDRYTAEDIGGQIVSELTYSMGDTDFSAQLTEFKNLNPAPAVLFISSNPGEIGTIVKQARDLGLTQPILGGDGYDTPLLVELAGDASRDVFFTTHQGVFGDAPEGKAFAEAYQTKYGKAPEVAFAALGYDGIKLMADAINRAGSLEGEAIRDALAATQGFNGATGTISYEEGSRIPSKSVALVEIRDKAPALIEIVVPKTIPPA